MKYVPLILYYNFKRNNIFEDYINSPPRTSHDIWVVAPSGYGPSCEVASRPASFTMTGTLGGTEKSMKKMALLTLLTLLALFLVPIKHKLEQK